MGFPPFHRGCTHGPRGQASADSKLVVLGGRGCLPEQSGFGEALMASLTVARCTAGSSSCMSTSVCNDPVTRAGASPRGSQATACGCLSPAPKSKGQLWWPVPVPR